MIQRRQHSRKHIHMPANTGEVVADAVVAAMGSWRFIIIQTVIVAVWIILNLLVIFLRYDPYPFILLNLVFSTQAAYASPLILMSQNRQSAKDAQRDNLEAQEVASIFSTHELLIQINQQQLEILKRLGDGSVKP